jgi:hypothetical protein
VADQHQQQRQQRQQPPPPRASEQTQTTSASPASVTEASQAQRAGKHAPGFSAEPQTVTAGRDGARNLSLEWITVWLEGGRSARFVVRTATGNELQVHMEQLAYRKSETGVTQVNTQPVPVAPIGTKGKLVARDMTTGEILEQPWTWILLGGGGGGGAGSLWDFIKRLFWKG